jgi:exopolysaccharide biosynthesis predicted pyruvyltransferase EpsI
VTSTNGEGAGISLSLRAIFEETLDRVIPAGCPVALIDVPNHDNCGDNAILVGELAYLKRRHADIRLLADHRAYSADRLRSLLPPTGVILLHGGGNIGASWPNHQRLRQRVLRDFPDRQVVVMPQSIWAHGAEAEQTAADYGRHEQFTLLVRDQASLVAAREKLGVDATLCPDAAFGLDQPVPEIRRQGALWLLRVDGGAVDDTPPHIGSVDWPPERGSDYVRRAAMRVASRAATVSGAVARFSASNYLKAAQHRTEDALRLLYGRQLVCTDRLHGCILGILAGTPLVLVPEKTGKLQSFHQTWLTEYVGTTMANDLNDALQRVAVASIENRPENRARSGRKRRDRASAAPTRR